MRLLIVIIFCFLCSCTSLADVFSFSAGSDNLANIRIKDREDSRTDNTKESVTNITQDIITQENNNYNGDNSASTESFSQNSSAGKDNARLVQSKQQESLIGNSNIAENGVNKINKLDTSKLKKIKTIRGELKDVYLSAWSNLSDRKDLIELFTSGEVIFRDQKSNYKNAYSLFKINDGFTSSAVHWGNSLFAVSYPGEVKIIDLTKGDVLYSLNRVKTRVNSMEFQPQGESLMLAGVDGVLYRWQFVLEKNADTIKDLEKSLERYIGHSSVVNLVRFHPFGRVFVSTAWDGVINAWLLYDKDKYKGQYDENIFLGRTFAEDVSRAKGTRESINIIEQGQFTSDGQYFYLADEDGNIEIWLVRGFKKVLSVAAHKGKIYDLNIDADSSNVATDGRDGKVKIWALEVKETKVPGAKEYILNLLKEINLKDQGIEQARKILFLNKNKLLVVSENGEINLIDV